MITLISSWLLRAVGLVIHAVKLSMKVIALLWLSICRCIRSALKKRNKIGDRGEP